MTIGERILIVLVVIAIPLTLIGVPVFYLMGGMEKFARKPLEKRFAGLDLHDKPQPGDVSFVYHTYRGFLIWCVQDEFRVFAPPADAKLLLSRLLRFNLTWGMLSNGVLFVPFLAIGNYYVQKRAIQKQEQELACSNEPGS